MDNYINAMRKSRDCSPRLSKSPDPEDPWPEGYETPVQSNEEIAEENKTEAKDNYNTLIQISGRPTRAIQFNPRWKKVLVAGELCYQDAEQVETLFYDSWHNSKRDCVIDWTKAGCIALHWAYEARQFGEELRRWQGFLDVQQWRREHRPEFAREEDMERQRYPQDPQLTASLKKLKDWKEYQVYFHRGIDRCKQRIEEARRAVDAIQRKDPEVILNKGQMRGLDDEDWLRTIERKREWLAAEEKRLEWVKQQLPAVLSECAASLMESPTSRREMELRSELEAKAVFDAFVKTGGRPTRPVQPVPDSQERDYTDEHLYVLCHWQGECSQLEEELREWKKFLDYRQKQGADGRTEVQLEEQQSAETPIPVELWKDYRAYQQLEVENAKQWVEFWQRQMQEFQDTENRCALEDNTSTAERYHSRAEDARSYIEEMRKQVQPAEMRLEWIEEQLSALLANRADSMIQVSMSDRLEVQAKRLKRTSRSFPTTLKDVRSNRSGKSAPRSNHDKEKNGALANPALGPVHPSRVSKTAGRKAPHRQRHSKTLAERDDRQNPDTITEPLLSAKVAPRRSNRLSNNEKRSVALEVSSDVNLGKDEHSSPTIPRKSDRISKQKQRINTPISVAAVNSAVILQSDMSRRPSRPKRKDRCAGNKPNTSSVEKPRGISKRHENNFSRKRTRIHS